MYTNDDLGYVKGRLLGTVISHRNKAVLVNNVVKNSAKKPFTIASMEILTDKEIADTLDNYDLVPVPLGFVNLDNDWNRKKSGAIYLSRTPIRQDWRQGFRMHQARFEYNDKGILPDLKSVAETIEGIFPSLDEAAERAKQAGRTAWTRHFAVNNDGGILYRGFGLVGSFLNIKDREFKLDEKCHWVEDRLKQVI